MDSTNPFPRDERTEKIRAMLLKEKLKKERPLLVNIKQHLPELQSLFQRINSEWAYEDKMYRFYHGSFKVRPAGAYA